ncbi:DPP IV N-terminal domain-containing protein, partial [uncultured Mucilaginibacter sp.]|uniref:DPP IV N-terminal domain-containing protein n=1 Tax=uncultured Mucilaginibacter sp. TaxID=797541 RepID=UPI0025E32294
VGTGGVTEGLKNRIVMPFMETNQTTRHVIGHEMVHAFQYHSLLDGDQTQFSEIGNLPLWMIEGMAEYLSLGKKDAYTAMWMRDAYLNKNIPTIRDLTESNKYFPYRYGEAFWSFIGSTYGDTIIVPFFKNTARYGLDYGIRRTFGYDEKTLSSLWKNAIQKAYKPYLKDTAQIPPGQKIIDYKNSGQMNVAPAISPDGQYVAFLSEKDLFSIDLYLADAKTGKILKKLTSKISNTHIDEFNFIESAGAWSPDSKQFAFSVFSGGRNKLVIVDVSNGKILHEISMEKAEQFSYVTWSPNGKDIVFSGMSEGQSDLYNYNLEDRELTQLTNDIYSDYQPSFSHDGTKLVFASDRTTYDKSLGQTIPFNLAVMDVATRKITDITVFNGANNLNPQFSSDDKYIYFLSNRDGFRNMYRYRLSDGQVEQMTDLFTGICGITEYSPALSISNNNDIVYSYYLAQKYALYNAKDTDFKPKVVDPNTLNFDAALLPPFKAVGVDLINSNLNNYLAYQKISADSIQEERYRPQFKLDYLASSGVGVGVNTVYGAGLASGIQGVFSDILGRNQIFAAASVNGEVYDFGAQVAYINQKGRWNYGVALSHIPYQYGFYNVQPNNYQVGNTTVPGYELQNDIIRNFQDGLQLFTSYPFSKVYRAEFGTGAIFNYFRVDRYYTDEDQYGNYLNSGHYKVANSDEAQLLNVNLNSYALMNVNTAFVGDNSYFGITAPLNGFRYRFGMEYDFGTYNFLAPTIDVRKYVRVKPVTFAARFFAYGRLGSSNQLYPLYVGYPFYIRGYEANSFYNSTTGSNNGFTIDQLSGSRIAVANFEVRLPFTGPEKLSQIPSKFFFSDLNFFFDAGLAWNAGDAIKFESSLKQTSSGTMGGITYTTYENARIPATSVGISLRINVFGAFILEPYYAFPFQRDDVSKPVFGLNFTPGW